jgi:hypothetical protein
MAAARVPRLVRTGSAPRFAPVALEKFEAKMRTPEARHSKTFFDAETRNPEWAKAMEQQLKGRFSPERLESPRLSDIRLDNVECRASSCQLEVSWGQATADHVASLPGSKELIGADPVAMFTVATGAFGKWLERAELEPGDVRVPGTWRVRLRPDGRYATREIVLFGAEEIDPDDYGHWVQEARAGLLRNRPTAAMLLNGR